MWIPQGNSRRAVTREHVEFLDSPPQRPYTVIGIITPPSREYETLAEAVKAMRKEAAKHGADAVFIESQTSGGWRSSFGSPGSWGGGSGGSFREVTFRAKAIVWSFSPSPLTSSTAPMFPTAKAVPGKPGYVFSPFDTKGRYIDVRGYPETPPRHGAVTGAASEIHPEPFVYFVAWLRGSSLGFTYLNSTGPTP